jgi:hypothetical protein
MRGIQYAAASRLNHWRLWNTGAKMKICSSALHCAVIIRKKRNIARVSGVEFRLQQERTNAENIDYGFHRAAYDRGVCAGHREIPGLLGVLAGTPDAEEQDFDRAGCVRIRTGSPEEDRQGPRPFGKRARQADDDRIGHDQEEVLVVKRIGPAGMPGRFAWARALICFSEWT